jgi:hypothetical protein
MRKFWLAILACGLVLGLSQRAAAADDDLKAVVAKALKAHGGLEKLNKFQAVRTKTKGTLEIMGNQSNFSQESAIQYPNKIKDQMMLDLMGNEIRLVTVYDGKNGWIKVNDMDAMAMNEQLLGMMKDTTYMMDLIRMTMLQDKKVELAPLGEAMVNGKPAVGVKVSTKGQKDVNLYFDKGTGLLAKLDHRTLDLQSLQEVGEERIMLEYQDVDGLKIAKKVLINRDGKKFLEAEVMEVKHADKIDDSEFVKP